MRVRSISRSSLVDSRVSTGLVRGRRLCSVFSPAAVFAICVTLLIPVAAAGPSFPNLTLNPPFHGTQVVAMSSSLTGCGKVQYSDIVPFAFASGKGGFANVSSDVRSCRGFPAGALNVGVFYDIVNVRFHGLNGVRAVFANITITGAGGLTLNSGTCGKGNGSSWSCYSIAQSSLGYDLLVQDLTNGSAYGGSGRSVGNTIVNNTWCKTAGGCAYRTTYNTCTFSGCVYVTPRAFASNWSGTSRFDGWFNLSTMNRSHSYLLQIFVSEWTWVACQDQSARLLNCAASAWVRSGASPVGVTLSSITVR
jgi:hypothetical protein